LPEYPFESHEEWTMVEWLGTSGISNAQIDSLLQTDWMKKHPLSSSTSKEMWKRIDEHLAAGPAWHAQEIVLPEAPNENFVLYYRDIVECLSYLEQNPAFEGFMKYEPVLWYSDEEL
ncbi:hypothetical protein K439DRAFT_1260949, partial [Ramaria rubella]